MTDPNAPRRSIDPYRIYIERGRRERSLAVHAAIAAALRGVARLAARPAAPSAAQPAVA